MLTADTVEPDAADAGDWRMRAASDVTADTPTPKHAARCNGCPMSVWGYTCSCSVAEPRLGLGRGEVITTPSAILLTKRLDISCVVCLNANNHAQKNIAHANDGGGACPPGSALACEATHFFHSGRVSHGVWKPIIYGLSGHNIWSVARQTVLIMTTRDIIMPLSE